MPARVSEAFVLRTYPFQEADLVVSFFTRDQGKLRGVAKRARRPKSGFGSSLERLTQANIAYFERENRELVTLDNCELIRSQFRLSSEYESAVAMDFVAEIADEILPPHEPNEKFYRLLSVVLDHLHAEVGKRRGAEWTVALYFSLWAVRLTGILPDLRVTLESQQIAREMMERSIRDLPERQWTRETGADLRRFLVRLIQDHAERTLRSAPLLESL
jgi:DNA repair protein RecO (recombination protein O)